MAEERSSETAPKRRARRATGTRSARTTRTTRGAAATRRRTGGGDMVQNLNGMIDELIKENRKLKRQVDRLTAFLHPTGDVTDAYLEPGARAEVVGAQHVGVEVELAVAEVVDPQDLTGEHAVVGFGGQGEQARHQRHRIDLVAQLAELRAVGEVGGRGRHDIDVDADCIRV